jgi:hypothetical protein
MLSATYFIVMLGVVILSEVMLSPFFES